MKQRLGSVLAGLALLATLGACAEIAAVAPGFVGRYLTVSLDPVVAFPSEVTLDGFDGTAAGNLGGLLGGAYQAATGQSLKQKAGRLIAGRVEPCSVILTSAFKDEIKRRNLYAGVVESGGNVQMRLSVARYGLKALPGMKSLKPVLDVKCEILLPQVGVVWSKTYTVDESSAQTLALSVTQVLDGAASFQTVFQSASTLAAQGALAELK